MTKKIAKDVNGMAYAEYLVLVVALGLPVAAAFVALGLQLLDGYQHALGILTSPIA